MTNCVATAEGRLERREWPCFPSRSLLRLLRRLPDELVGRQAADIQPTGRGCQIGLLLREAECQSGDQQGLNAGGHRHRVKLFLRRRRGARSSARGVSRRSHPSQAKAVQARSRHASASRGLPARLKATLSDTASNDSRGVFPIDFSWAACWGRPVTARICSRISTGACDAAGPAASSAAKSPSM